MAQEQALRRNPFGTEGDAPQALKPTERKVPESKDILKQLDSALKDAQSSKDRKRQILQRCGCL